MPSRENEVKELNLPSSVAATILLACVVTAGAGESTHLRKPPPAELAEFFAPLEQYRSNFGNFRPPLIFTDGTRVQNPADWQRRRKEILSTWHNIIGPWPPLIERPRVEVVNTSQRESITQQQLRIEIALGGEMVDALLLVPNGVVPAWKRPAQKRPAVRSEEHTSELQSRLHLVCRLLLEK